MGDRRASRRAAHNSGGARCAMTLIEVMLALAILVVLSAGVTGFFFQISARRDRLVEMASRQHDAAVLFGRLESAVMCAVAVGPDGEAGIHGDETSLTVLTRSVSPMLGGDAAVGDTAVVGFVFDESAQACTLSLGAVGGQAAEAEPVLGRVERVRLRYSDGRNWTGTFDSVDNGGLPVAIEVSVWFGTASDSEESDADGTLPGEMTEEELADFEQFGPMDFAEPEMDGLTDEEWVPREPDHVRVIAVPDAPEWKAGSA